MIYVDGESSPTFKHDSREDAEKEAKRLSEKLDKEAYILESVSVLHEKEINVKINSYEKACKYLGIGKDDNNVCRKNNKHYKAIVAIFKLVTIAEAWNKADDFVPDFSNSNQYKYFPWFIYHGALAGFAFTYTNLVASHAAANVGSRLCFKSSERAEQFGKQFIDLWNDFLLIK
jgi:hypothetical protein